MVTVFLSSAVAQENSFFNHSNTACITVTDYVLNN